MQNRFSTTLGRKVRLGRLAVPIWAIAAAGLTIAAVAGQAVGPVLTGSVSGSTGLVVSQTVVLDSAPTGSGTDDFAATVNDEGTAFTVALETQVGQNQTVTLDLANKSGKSANVILELNVPAGIDVDANEGGGAPVAMAQLNQEHLPAHPGRG